MNTFQVYREGGGNLWRERIASDGTPLLGTEEETDDYMTRLMVYEFEDDSPVVTGVKYYYGEDEDELLEQIKRDYPAKEWQNHDW